MWIANHLSSLLQKHIQSKGPSLHRHYPASAVHLTLSDTRSGHRPFRRCWRRDLLPSGLPPITQTAFPACRAQYPGGLKRCERWFLPSPHGLPRFIGGSASTTILSRPAQASLVLRPARLLTHHAWALLRGFITTGCPLAMLASYQT